MSPEILMWILGAVAATIVTLVSCTAAIIVFLWKKFDAVYEQIEEIKISQSSKFVKHEVCSKRIEDMKIDRDKDIRLAISKHEEAHHSKTMSRKEVLGEND